MLTFVPHVHSAVQERDTVCGFLREKFLATLSGGHGHPDRVRRQA
jgi:hypothetical protein